MVTLEVSAIATGAPAEAGAAEKFEKGLVSTMAKIESFSKGFALALPAVAAAAFAALLAAPAAQAQSAITSSSAPAANQPSITTQTNVTTSGNTTVVNIVAPVSGVSHNIYQSFNVDANGLVLNNSTGAGTSKLVGTLGANTNSGFTTSASLILNEVTGNANPSLLAGMLEVFGGKADVIIANPGGVTCSGCSFYNTPRVTLTTGVPNADGSQYTVTGGSVVIGPGNADLNGLDYFDIIARSVSAQPGGTLSNSSQTNVRMLAGRNTYNYNNDASKDLSYTSSQDANTGTGIDLAALGGANVGQIALISTDKGVGINTPSNMSAANGGINLTANGKIVFNNASANGSIIAKSDGTSASNGITVNGQVSAQGGVDFLTTTSGDIQLGGSVIAQTTLALKAAGAVTVGSGVTASSVTGSTIEAGTSFTNNGGTVSSSNAIGISAISGDLTNTDNGLISGKTLKLAAAATLSNKVNSKLTASADITLSAPTLSNDGAIHAGATLDVTNTVNLINKSTGTIAADGALTAGVVDLTNSGTISGQSLNVAATGTLDNQAGGQLTSDGAMTLSAHTITNANSISAGSTLDVNNTVDLVNTGQIAANGALTASLSGDLTNTNSISGQTVAATVSGTLDNKAGASITSVSSTSLTAGSVTNGGTIDSSGATSVTTTSGDLTNTGQITATQDATIKVLGTLTNQTTGRIHADGTLTISAWHAQELRRPRHPNAARGDLRPVSEHHYQRRCGERGQSVCHPRPDHQLERQLGERLRLDQGGQLCVHRRRRESQ